VAQALGLALDIFGLAALVAGVTSLVVALSGARVLPPGMNERLTLPLALALGYCAGYVALPRNWAALVPQPAQSWQWLPHLAIATAAISIATVGRHLALRLIVLIVVSVISGWLLTPTWPIFGLERPASIAILSGYIFVMTAVLGIAPPRRLSHPFIGLLALVAAIMSAWIGAAVSIRFAQLGAIAAAGLAGCWGAVFFSTRPTELAFRTLVPLYGVLVGGIAFIACVEPEPPLVALLLVPALPLVVSPFARRTIG
jgi:hypothetical protein